MAKWHLALAAGRAAFTPVNSPLSGSVGRQPSPRLEWRRDVLRELIGRPVRSWRKGLKEGGMTKEKEREENVREKQRDGRQSDFWVSNEALHSEELNAKLCYYTHTNILEHIKEWSWVSEPVFFTYFLMSDQWVKTRGADVSRSNRKWMFLSIEDYCLIFSISIHI